jgi:hypothetical protein
MLMLLSVTVAKEDYEERHTDAAAEYLGLVKP